MNFYNKILFRSTIALTLLAGSSRINSATQHDEQTWVNLTTTGFIAKQDPQLSHFKYWLEGQERMGDNTNRFTQTLARAGLGYTLTSDFSLWAGYAWIHTGAPNTTQPFNEDRIWEQLLWVKKIKQTNVMSRTRLEQRFLANNGRTAYRIRQLVKVSIPLSFMPKFSSVTSDEVFWHKNDFIGRNGKGFDQNRLFVGIGYSFNEKSTVEIGYMNQYIRRFGIPNFQANILSINAFVNF